MNTFKNMAELDKKRFDDLRKANLRKEKHASQEYQDFVQELIEMCDQNFIQKIRNARYIKTHKA